MSRLLMASSTSNTHKTYRTGWRAFCSFKRFDGNIPASSEDVRRFIAWLSLQRLAPSTIATYVAGVGYFHKIKSWPDPTQDFLVTKLIAGCRRDNSTSDNRWPIYLTSAEPYFASTSPCLQRPVRSGAVSSRYAMRLFRIHAYRRICGDFQKSHPKHYPPLF